AGLGRRQPRAHRPRRRRSPLGLVPGDDRRDHPRGRRRPRDGAIMPTLVLLRHAKAEAAGPSDVERKLSASGRSQAKRVAARLVTEGLIPDVVLCSAALRAQQTWEQVAAGLTERGHGVEPVVHVTEELYSARPETVAGLVAVRSAGE